MKNRELPLGLNITLEEEDGAIIKVEYPENGTAEGLVNRLKKAAFEEFIKCFEYFNLESLSKTILNFSITLTFSFY